MANRPFYEQEYHEVKNDIPNFKFGQIFKTFFTKPFKWNARDTRKNFWVGYAIQFIGELILSLIMIPVMLPSYSITFSKTGINANLIAWQPFSAIGLIIIVLLAIYLKLCLLGTAIRRLHDTDHEGWWILLYFVPTFGWIIVLYFMVIPTTEQPVRWGSYLEFE